MALDENNTDLQKNSHPTHIYNTFGGKKELFQSINPQQVGMYHCGPTVYDSAHIGNLRTFVFDDLVRRLFEYNGYKVNQVMNITDVDDKTIKRSVTEGMSLQSLTQKYEEKFLHDIEALNILKPHHLLRATEHISEMIELITALIEKGSAYKADDGVYMNIEKVKNYGALAKLDLTSITKERINNDEYDKENPRDFVLWKFESEHDAGNAWDADFGRGRPGWHIECSAMAKGALGDTFDIHTGGTDLIFPHHTNEIAQSESANEKQFANYWMHGGFMNIDDMKMSKSKGNFLKLEDLVEEGIDPLSFRYWLLTANYRSVVNFTLEAVKAAQTGFEKLIKQLAIIVTQNNIDIVNPDNSYTQTFNQYINDDMDVPKAIAMTWEILKNENLSPSVKIATIYNFDLVFGLSIKNKVEMKAKELISSSENNQLIPSEITALAESRQTARINKEWAKADQIRDELKEKGYEIIDNEDGTTHIKSLI